MRTAIKLIIGVVALFGIATSCKKEDHSGDAPHGYMTVKMTDAPADYLAINIDITGMEIHTATDGWISVPIRKGIYNLLELQNNIAVVIVDDNRLPAGNVSQVRFILGSNNTIVNEQGSFPLKVPSGEESGLKVNINEVLDMNEHMVVLLDFDAKASVVQNGAGDYHLKPVIKIKSISQL